MIKLSRSMSLIGVVALAMLASACSPISNYEERLEVVEKKLAANQYTKRAGSGLKAIGSLSTSEGYQALVDEEKLKALTDARLAKISAIRAAAVSLRKAEDLRDDSQGRAEAGKRYHALQKALAELAQLERKQLLTHQHLKSMVDERAAMEAALRKAHDAFVAVGDKALSAIVAAKEKHPHQQARLDGFANQLADFDAQYLSLLAFYAIPAGEASYAKHLQHFEAYQALNVKDNFPKTLAEDYVAAVAQLDTSYVKRLISMNEHHSIMMGMVTWDNYYDYPTEHTVAFPYVDVNAAQLQAALSRFSSGVVMRDSHAKSDRLLATLTANKMASSWARGDDEGEIYVNDHESEYVHKYLMTVNEQQTEIEESVSQAFYRQHEQSIGKDVVVKPYGMFEDEVITDGSEPGLALVGNPAYGSWNGNSWMWAALFLPHYSSFDYDRRDYKRYRERRHSSGGSYYGSGHPGGYGKYGLPKQSQYSPVQYKHTQGASKRDGGATFRNRSPRSGK
jgi:hypothetical protein